MDDQQPAHLRAENADRIEIDGDLFIRLEGGIYWRPRRRLLMSEARMTAPQFADALAARLKRSDQLVDVITRLRERSWLDVADCLEPHLLKRRDEEAAAAALNGTGKLKKTWSSGPSTSGGWRSAAMSSTPTTTVPTGAQGTIFR